MVHPADSIEVAARAMRSYRTDSAAVVDPEPRVSGGVLLSDLFPVIISRNELHGTVESRMSRTRDNPGAQRMRSRGSTPSSSRAASLRSRY